MRSLQSCLTLCETVDHSPPGSSVHGVLQARMLEWVGMTSSRGSSWPRDGTRISCDSCTADRFFTAEPHTGEALDFFILCQSLSYVSRVDQWTNGVTSLHYSIYYHYSYVCPNALPPFVETLLFLLWVVLAPSSKISWSCLCVAFSGFSNLFPWSIYQPLCQ